MDETTLTSLPEVSKDKNYVVAYGHNLLANIDKSPDGKIRKSISRLPRSNRIPVNSTLHRPSVKQCGEPAQPDTPKPGRSTTESPDPASRKEDQNSDVSRLKSNIPKRTLSPKRNKSKCACHPSEASVPNPKNCQRVQLVNISPDFANRPPPPDSKSLSTAKPIPPLGPIYRQINNVCLNDWFMDSIDDYLAVPPNSFNSATVDSSDTMDRRVDTPQAIIDVEIRSTDLDNERREISISTDPVTKVFKTTHENIKDWLDNDMQYPTKDIESGYNSVNPPEQPPIDMCINTTIKFKQTGSPIKESRKVMKNACTGEPCARKQRKDITDIEATPVLLQNTHMSSAKNEATENPKTDFGPESAVGKAFSKCYQFPSKGFDLCSSISSCAPQPAFVAPVSSYVECPSEILQRTTNLDNGMCTSQHLNAGILETVQSVSHTTANQALSSQNTDSIAATDLEIRNDFSQFTLEQLDLIDDQSECRRTSSKSHSILTYDIHESNPSIAGEHWDYRFDDLMSKGKNRYSSMRKNTLRRRERHKYDFYLYPKGQRKYLLDSRHDWNSREGINNRHPRIHKIYVICRRRWNSVWHKTTSRWGLWGKTRLKSRGFRTMSFLQRAMLWEDVDVQTTMMFFRETGTSTLKDQRSIAIETSLRLNTWLANYNKLHSVLPRRNALRQFNNEYISRGPSMFPLFANSKNKPMQFLNGITSFSNGVESSTSTYKNNMQSLPNVNRNSWIKQFSFDSNKVKSTSFTQTAPVYPFLRMFNSAPARPMSSFQTCARQTEDIPNKDGGTSMGTLCTFANGKPNPMKFDFDGTTAFALFSKKPKLAEINVGTDDLPFNHGCLGLHVHPLITSCVNTCTQCGCQCFSSHATEFPFLNKPSPYVTLSSGQMTSDYDNITGMYKPQGYSTADKGNSRIFTKPSSAFTCNSTNISSKPTVDVIMHSNTSNASKLNNGIKKPQKSSLHAAIRSPPVTSVRMIQTDNQEKQARSACTTMSNNEIPKKECAIVTEPKDHKLILTDVKVLSISSAVLPPKEGTATSTKSDIYGFEESTSTERFTACPIYDIDINQIPVSATREIHPKRSIGLTAGDAIGYGMFKDGKISSCNTSVHTMDSQVQYSNDDLKSVYTYTSMSTNTDEIIPLSRPSKGTQNSASDVTLKQKYSKSAQYVSIEEPVEAPPLQKTCSNGTITRVVTISRGLSAIVVSRPRGRKNAHVQYSNKSVRPESRISAAVLTEVNEKRTVGEMTSQIQTTPEPNDPHPKLCTADAGIQHSHFTTQFITGSQRSNRIGRSQLMSVFTLSNISCEAGTQVTTTDEQGTIPKLEASSKPFQNLNRVQSVMTYTSHLELGDNAEAQLTEEKLVKKEEVPDAQRIMCGRAEVDCPPDTDASANTVQISPPLQIETPETISNEDEFKMNAETSRDDKTPNPIVPKALSSNIHTQRPHSCPRSPAFSLDSKLDAQLVCLSRLMGKAKWSQHKTESSSLNAAKWITRCGFPLDNELSKDYQSLLNLEKETSESLHDMTNDQASSVNKFNVNYNKRSLSPTISTKKESPCPVHSADAAEPLITLSKDSLADVLPMQKSMIQQKSEGKETQVTKVAMLDKVTSDVNPPKEVKENELQATPESCEAGTNTITLPFELKMHKSESAFTSRVVLPPCHCKARDGEMCADCVFVYDRPKCLIHHKSLTDASIQRQPSRRDVELDTQKEHAVDEYVGSTTSMGSTCTCNRNSCEGSNRSKGSHKPEIVIGEVLSPRVYKALYETSKLVAKTLPRRYSTSSNITDTAVATEPQFASNLSTQIYTSDKVSAAILTSHYSYEEIARKRKYAEIDASTRTETPTKRSFNSGGTSPYTYSSAQYCNISTQRDSFLRHNKDGVTQYCSSCRAKLVDLPQAAEMLEVACGSLEECVKSQLMGSCRYYSNLLTRHIGRVKETLTRQLSPATERRVGLDKAVCKDLPQVEVCTMKPSRCNDTYCQTKRRAPNHPSSAYVTTALSGIDICGSEKENLKLVYYTLSAIEGRIRRLRNNMPD